MFLKLKSTNYQVIDQHHRHLQTVNGCPVSDIIECVNGYVNGSPETDENRCTVACDGYYVNGTRKVGQGGCCISGNDNAIQLGVFYSDPCYQLTAHICNEPASPNCVGSKGKLFDCDRFHFHLSNRAAY